MFKTKSVQFQKIPLTITKTLCLPSPINLVHLKSKSFSYPTRIMTNTQLHRLKLKQNGRKITALGPTDVHN